MLKLRYCRAQSMNYMATKGSDRPLLSVKMLDGFARMYAPLPLRLRCKVNTSFAAVMLVATSIAASAQEANRSDMFGQDAAANAGDAVVSPTPAAARKVNITNASSPAAAAVQAAAQAGNGVIAPKALAKQAVDKSAQLSEFQKFISDNTGNVLPIFGAEFFANAPST